MSAYKLHSLDGESITSSVNESRNEIYRKSKRKSGCFVTTKTGFILTFLAMATAAMVGVIVTFAVPKDDRTIQCNCGSAETKTVARIDCPTLPATVAPTTQCPPTTCPDCASLNYNTTTTSVKIETTTFKPEISTSSQPNIVSTRLPRSVLPIHYNVILRPDIFTGDPKTFNLRGHVKIKINCTEPTTNITMHINNLDVDNSTILVEEDGGHNIGVKSVSVNTYLQFLVLHLSSSLSEGRLYTVEMNFTGTLRTTPMVGLYVASFLRNSTNVYLAITQFQPTDARRAFPCFDEPALKAKFNITLERRNDGDFKDYITLSNMPQLYSYNSTDGFIADVYQESVVMPTYLLAFAVCDFKHKAVVESNWTMRTYAQDEQIQTTNFSLEVGVDMLKGFEDYFNIPYVLPKLDMIAIPDFESGAMENWGLIAYRTRLMLYHPDISTPSQQKTVAQYVAHELAHMWFGNLISPEWWDDLWLNEGFATFFEYIGVNMTRPDWNMMDLFGITVAHSAFKADSSPFSRTVFAKAEFPDEINALFDTITYYKGASIIRMMWHFIGPETLRLGLSRYIKQREYGNVNHGDLWNALTMQVQSEGKPLNLKERMETWINQRNFPAVMVTFNSSLIQVKQSRFVIGTNVDQSDSPYNYTWDIPFTYTTNVDNTYEGNEILWISRTEKEKTFAVSSNFNQVNWIIGNVQQFGFYRVNYDDRNWNAIINQLKTDHTIIHTSNRAQIINDLWSFESVNQVNLSLALQVFDYLNKETEYVPWQAASSEIANIRKKIKTKSLYGKLQSYMQNTIKDMFARVGMKRKQQESMNDRLLRSLIVQEACGYKLQDCKTQAVDIFNKWLNNGTKIYTDVKARVLCTGISMSEADVWDTVFERSSLVSPSERLIYLIALGCSREYWVLTRYMEYAFDETKVRRQEALYILLAVANNDIGLDIAWNYLRENWKFIISEYKMPFWNLNSLIRGITSNFNTEFRKEQVSTLKKMHSLNEPKLSALDSAVGTIEQNIQWINRNLPVIESWLSAF